MFLQLILVLSVLLYGIYKWATINNNYFIERGVPYEKPWPFFGNNLKAVLNRESFLQSFLDFYNRNKKNKVTGYFNFREPFFMICDPELIKKVTVKDFDHFPNHQSFISSKHDELMNGVVFNLKDQRWKDMRNTLTPVFTAAKMRAMFTLMNECFDECINYLKNKSKNGESFEFEMKECFTRLSNDIIASTAFGLKINSYEDRNNKFYKVGQSVTAFRGKQMFKFLLANIVPKIVDLFHIKVFDEEQSSYFIRLVADAMKYREEHKIVRPDMIQLLMEAKKESTQHWSDVDIAAQCFLFFFAAFENNANFICITCHELMRNPEIQERLYEEAKAVKDELQGAPLDYDTLGKLKYMDMCVSETLRKVPFTPMLDRSCAKDYKLTDADDNFVFDFKVGDHILIPIVGLQRDEEYFPNPKVYDPERFSPENKAHMNQFAYLPFGVGPRSCIGNRYALMQAKAMLYHLVLAYKMEPSAKSVGDIVEDVLGFQLNPPNGFWIRYVPRV